MFVPVNLVEELKVKKEVLPIADQAKEFQVKRLKTASEMSASEKTKK